uniref:TM2 domain-containing protein n=1 Tax=viral metagenome TaxID=1070528 RepID=A0A6C0DV01_9ZZZZ
MSSGVSQIEYWLGTNKNAGTNNQNSNGKEGGNEAIYLSYDVFMALAVIGGFFALDHLYLRSPLTFLAKIVINLLFFGVWWIWDALQAVFNDDVIKVFGLGVPSLGPKGIAAGVLANDVPDKKHMRFFIYAIALMFTGIFGVDSFLLGDKTSGFIRLISLITLIFSPIALGWWLYKLFKFFFDTKSVTNGNYEYFGAPSPPIPPSVAEKLKSSIPILGSIIDPLVRVKDAAVGAVENVGEFAEGVITNPGVVIDGVLRGPVQRIASFAGPVIEPVIKPVTNTVQMGLQTVDDIAGTARESLALGRNALDKGASLAQGVISTAGDVAKAASAALSVAPAIAGLSSGLTPEAISAAKTALTAQAGGGSASNVLPFVLMGTLALIAVSGFILTYRRSRQNEQPRKDDSPPEPGVLRESDKKESS